jgi:hypothetical protein
MDFEQPVRDVDAVIRVDPDQVGVERRMVDFVNGRPFETIGCLNCSLASIML